MRKNSKILKSLLFIQGVYTLITAIWPLIDIKSFMVVTGPKTDIWLVKTVAVVLLPIAAFYLINIYRPGEILHLVLIGVINSIGLAIIDFYYSGKNIISRIYAVDGALQVIFALCWIYVAFAASTGKKEGKFI
jgi:hypothetical protein